MVDNQNEKCVKFIKEYYRMLTRSPKLLCKFYSPKAQISIHRENEEPRVHTENHVSIILDKHRKKVEKVLISSLDSQSVNDMFLVAVIGELVYVNGSVVRYSQQFIVDLNEKCVIFNDNCRLLDEEIIFENKKVKKEGSVSENKISSKVNFEKGAIIKIVGCNEMAKSRALDIFHRVGKVWAIEIKDNNYFVEFSKAEDLHKIKNDLLQILQNHGLECIKIEKFVKSY